VEGFVTSGQNLMTMLTEIRAVYDMYLKPLDKKKLKSLSVDGTLSACLSAVSAGGGEGGGGHEREERVRGRGGKGREGKRGEMSAK
jgi:hypothetical protein